MEPRLQRRIQRYGWDKAALFYEQYWKQQLEPAQMCTLDMADLKPGESVLDVACGTGLVTIPAAVAVGSNGKVVGTDLSDKMIAFIRKAAEQRGIRHGAFTQMDAEDLAFADASFNAALCCLGLMYVPDPLKAVQELYRVLRPGGRAVAAVWGQRDRCGWAGIFPVVDARVETDVCPLFFQLGTHRLLQQTFEAAGFVDVVTERLPTILHYASAEAACGAAFAGGPVALAYARFDDATRAEAHAEYLVSIEPYRNGQRYEVPGEFVVVRGFKRS